MKIVLDTNVLVSGLLSPFRAPGEIVRMTSAGLLQLCHDARIISEYHQVLLRPKFGFDQTQISALLDQIQACGQIVASKPLDQPLPDPDDEPFLEVTLAGSASCLVTGNLKDYPAALRQGVKVLTPLDFLKFYRTES